jgi:formylglycine-generating enzyme required for sulfatase activity
MSQLTRYIFILSTFYFLLSTPSLSQTPTSSLAKMSIDGKPQKSANEFVSRRDANGKICAAIQVISDMDGFKYQSNNGIVGNVDDQPGRDLVYLSPNERVLEIFKSGYEPLKIILSEYGIQLREKEVWQIKIKGDAKTGDLLLVTFVVQPPDAVITIDGQPAKSDKPVKLSKGLHQLRIEKQGFQPVEETITVSEKEVLFRRTLKEVDIEPVQIRSTPDQARILLNGVEQGLTNKGLFLFPGTYQIKLSKSGYVEVEETINVVSGGQNNFTFNLVKNSGSLSLQITPTDATVLLNKQNYSQKKQIELAPGMYKLEISKNGYYPQSETFEIKRGESLQKTYSLTAKTGKLQFTVQPLDAKVTLIRNGQTVQTWNGMQYLKDLTVGAYTLKATAPGFATGEKQITIGENQTTYIDLTLAKGAPTKTIAGIKMVLVKGGTFNMGSNSGDSDEKPLHRVTLSDFYIGKYEVTQKQWREIMGNNPSDFKSDERPVEQVSWNDVQDFIRRLNSKTGQKYRLPTEAEWEYAARGGRQSRGYTYSGGNDIDAVAWYNNNSNKKNHPVGQKQANELGLHDMSGNVWEWCSDWYGKYSSGAQTNPTGPATGHSRVCRGGGWGSVAGLCRVAGRGYNGPGYGGSYLGFRLVLVP